MKRQSLGNRNVPTFRRSNVPTFLIFFLLVSVWFCTLPKAHAQLSSEAAASVITIYPGGQLYSAFGHTAIRISDPEQNVDRLYNYGTFDFDEPGFYLKFIRGKLDYRLSVAPAKPLLQHYRQIGRSTVEQRLSLEPAKVDDLYRFLEINYRPENRYYRYDFFFDNCSTRPRDALESAVDSLQFNFREDEEQLSFREHLDPYINDRPLIHLGIDLALGAPTDRTARPYETMFLPVELLEKLERATVISDEGSRPLVAQTDTLYWNGTNISDTAGLPWIDLILWIGALAALGHTWQEFRSRAHPSQWTFRIDALVYTVIGVIGLTITLLAVATEHAVVDPNWNLLWAWPTHLIAGHFLWRKQHPRLLRIYLAFTAVASFLMLAGWFWWPQQIPTGVIPVLLWQMARGIRYAPQHRMISILSSEFRVQSSEFS